MRKQHIFVLQRRYFIHHVPWTLCCKIVAVKRRCYTDKHQEDVCVCVCSVSIVRMLAAKMMGNPSLREIACLLSLPWHYSSR
jgi:hypothetical protein